MTIAATMLSRSVPLRSDSFTSHSAAAAGAMVFAAPVGWGRKAFALTMHLACLGLFWLLVVAPVVAPIASGELAREFKPVVEALRALVH